MRTLVPIVILLVLPLLASCGGSNIPSCLIFTPEHDTIDGLARAGETLQGDRVEDVIVLGTNAVDAAPLVGLTVLYDTNCDDEACAPTIECEPGTMDVGDQVRCDVIDDLVNGACSWTCQVSVTATVLDNDVCRDTLAVVDVAGDHVEAMPGR